jgi:hypothetical protein
MKNTLLTATLLALCCAAAPALADTVTYNFTVDTSSQSGQMGYIDLELNASSLPADDIMATVSNFTGASVDDSDLNNYMLNTSGMLPGDVSFDNQNGNDYFEALTFGNTISFTATLSGPGISLDGSAPGDPSLLGGTIFELSFLDPSMTTSLFTSDPSGTAAYLSVDADGTTSAVAQPGTTVAATTVAATPEPATLLLVGLAGVFVVVARRRFAVNAAAIGTR